MVVSFLASGFRIEPLSGTKLVVVNPPVMWVSIVCYGLAAVGLVMLIVGIVTRGGRIQGVIGAIIAAVLGLIGWTTSAPSTATLDKDAGTLTIHIGWARSTSIYPLEQVKYATVETTTAAYRLVFVLNDGHRVGLGSYSDQEGQPEAANAINQFLGVEDLRP
jgi:hypothetical protein